MPWSAQVQRDHSFYQMWVVETSGAWYRGAIVLQEEERVRLNMQCVRLRLGGTGGSLESWAKKGGFSSSLVGGMQSETLVFLEH